ncbi:MAG: hypothetical protein J0L58_20635, partial [Burkholderiales bacterium]|nr:hypothetical protein [Burkholderiales bacterium]
AGLQDRPYPQARRLASALAAALAVDSATLSGPLLAAGATGEAIGRVIQQARLRAVADAIQVKDDSADAPYAPAP